METQRRRLPHWGSIPLVIAVIYMAFFDTAARNRPFGLETILILLVGLAFLILLNLPYLNSLRHHD